MQFQKSQAEFPTGAICPVALQIGILALIVTAFWARPAHAQEAANHPDMSGFWELRFDSFNIPHASLTPQTAAANMADQEEHDRLSIRWCDQLGVPAIMAERQPLDIRQGPKEMAIVVHPPSSVRYIYTDGRVHPDKDDYDPTTNGHSIGHWEGDTLVVDTIYFNDRGVTRLPGGGIRTADSHLTEHFRRLNNGANLLVTFTWEDPKIFAKPHTYAYMYYKVAAPGMPRIYSCIASDAARAKFLTTDPQPGTGWPTN